jgi:hypothetical protein
MRVRRILARAASGLIGSGLALALVCALGGCGSSSGKAVLLGSVRFHDRGTTAVRSGASTRLETGGDYFSPTFLRGTPLSKAVLTLHNGDSRVHNFSITSQSLDQGIPAGGTVTVEVQFPASGALLFYCKLHTTEGMNGELLAGNDPPQAPGGAAAPNCDCGH